MTKTITAQMLAKMRNGVRIPPSERVFTQDDAGRWSGAEEGQMLESEVIDVCRRAKNWRAIRAEFFPMHGF